MYLQRYLNAFMTDQGLRCIIRHAPRYSTVVLQGTVPTGRVRTRTLSFAMLKVTLSFLILLVLLRHTLATRTNEIQDLRWQ
jgi:hypothetical protein